VHEKYYSRFKIVSHNLFWKIYLRWAYKKCIEDLKKVSHDFNFSKKDFTALLCGTSGDVTSQEFVKFVFSKNPNAEVRILDVSLTQLEKSKEVLSEKFLNAKIRYILSDAKATQIEDNSIDYLETDGLLEYFSKEDIYLLFKEWKRILKIDGIITLRAFASSSFWGRIIDRIRLFISKQYLGVTLYAHSLKHILGVVKKTEFSVIQGGNTFCPTFKRFSLYNK